MSGQAPVRLFVYGSLMTGFAAHEALLAGRPCRVVRARMAGRLYALPEGFPGATDGEGVVRGELLEFPDDEILGILDRYEGAGGDRPELYRRAVRPVTLADGSTVEAHVYLYADPARLEAEGVPLPDGDFRLAASTEA